MAAVNGMRVILTGHSRGLGAALAASLLARGLPVLALSRQPHPTLAASYPGRLREVSLDLGDRQALLKWLAAEPLAAFLDGSPRPLLINNAGMLAPMGLAGTLDRTVLAQAIEVTAPLLLADAFLAATTPAPDRRLLHVSSGAARQPYPGWSPYCAGKAALDQHARVLAAEHHPGLRVASVAPGVVDTDMQSEIRAMPGDAFPLRDRFVQLKTAGQLTAPAAAAEKLLDHLLGSRFGEPVVADLRDL